MLNQSNIKSSILNTVMSDPQTSKVVSDALNSPLGSSIRQKAASILKASLAGSGLPMDQLQTDNQLARNVGTVAPASSFASTSSAETATLKPLSKVIFPAASGIKSSTRTPIEDTLDTTVPTKALSLEPTVPEESQALPLGQPEIELPPASPVVPPKNTTTSNDRITMMNSEDTASVTSEQYENTLDEDERQSWDEMLAEAKADGVGKETFWTSIIKNEEKLREVEREFGFAEGTFPSGIYLTANTEETRKMLEEKENLKAYEDRVEQLMGIGMNLQPQLRSYIQSRDTYVKTIDRLRDSAINTMIESGSPWASNRIKNYITFLDVLKGRQQMNYQTYVDYATQTQERELKQAEDSYNDIKARINEALKVRTEDVKAANEKREILKGLIQEQLEIVQNSDKDAWDNYKLQQAIAEENARLAALSVKQEWEQKIKETAGEKRKLTLEQYEELESEYDDKYGMGEFAKNFPYELFVGVETDEESDQVLFDYYKKLGYVQFAPNKDDTGVIMSDDLLIRLYKEIGLEKKEALKQYALNRGYKDISDIPDVIQEKIKEAYKEPSKWNPMNWKWTDKFSTLK